VVGISFAAIFVRLALPAPPVVTGFYRMLFASAVLSVSLLLWRRRVRLPREAALPALAAGICFGTDIALWHTAIVRTSVAMATLLVNTTPLHVGLYSALVLRQRLRGRFVAGAALALGGCSALLGISRHDVAHVEGGALALAASVFYAGYLLLVTAARRRGDTLPALLIASLGATAALGVYALLRGDPFSGFPASSWLAMGGAALVSQVIGVAGIVWALPHLPTTVASVALLAQPVGTALLGWWLLGEALGPLQLAGGGAVLAGIALASRGSAPR
jgi:drug/metabolite transporter (DMT)-like permease